MAKRSVTDRIKLTSYEDLFGDSSSSPKDQTSDSPIIEISLEELYEFHNHPFRVVDDEQMEEMVESIKKHGVLVPAIARPRKEGGYELVSGHRRHHAAKLAGLSTMPVMVKDLDDDVATVIMVDANLQREEILVSEKAKAYRMKYEAMKHQGATGGLSLDAMSENTGESTKTIQRLISIANVDDRILELIDSKKLGIRQTIELASLDLEHQSFVYNVISNLNTVISADQAAQIKEAYKKGYCTEEYIRDYLTEKKPQKRKVTFSQKTLDNYFTPDISNEDINTIVTYHFKMFFRYVNDKSLNEIKSGYFFCYKSFVFMSIIVKSSIFTIVVINP